ncbi:23222_t:CDS:2 [Cetraspora pellucida]|uniref:23222_t:CDS:1 n=1 Tax=Cetraspora pellucida TaxID=1433469 RepID=A0A9N9DRQ5_9GLOM|nr:23222_t:CDS:2 [Cetraspora pellucida]
MFSDNEDIVVHSSSFDKNHKKQKISNTYTSGLELSQTKYGNIVDSNNHNASNECYNLANSNSDTVTDKNNNPINEESSILSNEPNDILNSLNLKEIKTIIKCLVEVYKNHKNKLCEHIMGSVNSLTGNYIRHLAMRHGITKNQKFVELLIKDQQPISIRNDEGLKDFIAEFNLSYKFPSEKYCQQLLSETYKNIKQSLLSIFEKNIILCSLTCDLWTRCNKLGAINTITNNLILTDDVELWEVNYKDDIIVFDDTNLNEDHIESINLQKQLNIPQDLPSEEEILAALLDLQCKALSFTSESLKFKTYDSLCKVYQQHQNQTNISLIKLLLPSTNKLLASMFQLNNAQVDEVSDYIGIPKILYDQCPFK